MGRSGRGLRVRGARLAGVALVGALLGGCYWQQPGAGPGHARYNPDEKTLKASNVASLTEKWSVEVPGTLTEPVTDGDRAYSRRQSGGSSAEIRAFDLDTGGEAWTQPLAGFQLADTVVPVAFSGDSLLNGHIARFPFGTPPCGDLTRYDPETGAVLGVQHVEFPTSTMVTSGSIVAYMDSLRCQQPSFSGRLVVLDRATSNVLWTASVGPETMTPPTIGGGRIYLIAGNMLYAYDAAGCGASTCEPLWSSEGRGGTIVAVGDTVFVYGGRSNPPPPPPHPGGGFSEMTIDALSAATGEELWTTTPYAGEADPEVFYNEGGINGFAVAGDTIHVTGYRDSAEDVRVGALETFAVAGCGQPQCPPLSSTPVDAAATHTAVAGDVVYTATADTLFAFAADGCATPPCPPLATVPLAGTPKHLVVSAGKVLVVTEDAGMSTLTAYGLP